MLRSRVLHLKVPAKDNFQALSRFSGSHLPIIAFEDRITTTFLETPLGLLILRLLEENQRKPHITYFPIFIQLFISDVDIDENRK